MPKPFALAAMSAVAAFLLLQPGAARPRAAAGGLTDAPALATAYDQILRGHSDTARDALERACPPARAAACDTVREVSYWWDIQQDIWDRSQDARLEAAAATAIASASAWTTREPQRGEAWFYLAGAYAPISQWRVWRNQKFTAARDGKRIKDALERALALDPQLDDAWFGIGLYHYYADVAPAALKLLRMLLLLPGGDRAQGMTEMLRTRDRGALLRGEADYQLHLLYVWYEHQPDRALELLRGLDARYGSNPMFLERIAEVQHVYQSDHAASADTWRALLDRANAGSVVHAATAAARARVGLAAELVDLSDARRALDTLDALDRTRPTAPYGIAAQSQLTRGDAELARGARAEASSAYARVLTLAPQDDPDGLRDRARAGLARARARR